jgi:hypothetical protein
LGATRLRISIGLRIIAGLFLALSIYLFSGSIAARTPSHSGIDTRYSLLAVGDTGKDHRPLATLFEGQIAVAKTLELEHRDHPVDALLLLGDNFYMDGLRRSELIPRIRRNLVLPYCYFLNLDGPRSVEVESACKVPTAMRRPLPIYAVLGNHDLIASESRELQQSVIPQFIPNWRMDAEFAATKELAPGLSLVLFSSEEYDLDESKRMELVEALRDADGPMRILAAHTPMAIGVEGNPPGAEDFSLDFEQWVQSAIDEAGVKIQLYLSGHHHTLQVIEGEGTYGPALHFVAGSGARSRAILAKHPRRRYEAEKLGFARVDLVGQPGAQRLLASLFRSATIPLSQWGGPQLVTRWSIGEDGGVERIR